MITWKRLVSLQIWRLITKHLHFTHFAIYIYKLLCRLRWTIINADYDSSRRHVTWIYQFLFKIGVGRNEDITKQKVTLGFRMLLVCLSKHIKLQKAGSCSNLKQIFTNISPVRWNVSCSRNRKWGNLWTWFTSHHITRIRLYVNTKFHGPRVITSLPNQIWHFEDWDRVSCSRNRKWGNLWTWLILHHITRIRLYINTKFHGLRVITSLPNQFYKFEDWDRVPCSKNSF